MLGSKASLALTPSVEDGCSIYVNEKAVKVGEAVQIDVGQTNTTVKIRLEAGGAETEYTLVLRPSTSCVVQIPIAADDISLTVCDENGQTVYGNFNASLKTYRYLLIPGRRYTYTATKDQYYHAAETFTAAAKTLSKVDVETGEWLTDLALAKDGAKDSKGNIELDQRFTSNIHRYTAVVPDTPPAVYLWVDGEIKTANAGFSARYRTIASTGQDEQEIYLGSLLNTGVHDEIWVSEDGEYHTVMIGNKEAQDNSMQVCHEAEHPVCLPKLLWIANALQKLLEQANGNLPIEKNENPELIRYAADIIRKYADGLSHDDRSVKEICEENSQNIA